MGLALIGSPPAPIIRQAYICRSFERGGAIARRFRM